MRHISAREQLSGEFEQHADPRCKFVGFDVYGGMLSIEFQVDGVPNTSKACADVGASGLVAAVREIAKHAY